MATTAAITAATAAITAAIHTASAIVRGRAIRAMVENAGYRGHCEVEILSAENWWKRDPDEVLRVCIERHRTVV